VPTWTGSFPFDLVENHLQPFITTEKPVRNPRKPDPRFFVRQVNSGEEGWGAKPTLGLTCKVILFCSLESAGARESFARRLLEKLEALGYIERFD
jgi:hypothetical protein